MTIATQNTKLARLREGILTQDGLMRPITKHATERRSKIKNRTSIFL